MNTMISPILTLNGTHVFTASDDYSKLTAYFNSNNFIETIQDKSLTRDLLAELSSGLTNMIRVADQFEWSSKAVAVVSRARAIQVDEDTQNVVFEVGIITEY